MFGTLQMHILGNGWRYYKNLINYNKTKLNYEDIFIGTAH
jgi:hypothetical protein